MIKLSLTLSVWIAAVLGLFAVAGTARGQTTEPGQPGSEPTKAPESAQTTEEPVYLKMTTSLGDIILELDKVKAPETVANFLRYTDSKYYDGTIFHRVVKSFMIQGGGFTADLKQKKTEPSIKNEWKNGLKNVRGSIAMARMGGRADSATSQFFINVQDNAGLDRPNDGAGYAVFGKVVEGMETVDKIRDVAPGKRTLSTLQPGREGYHDLESIEVPIDTVTIQTVARLTDEDVKALRARLAGPPSAGEPKPETKPDNKAEPKPAPKP